MSILARLAQETMATGRAHLCRLVAYGKYVDTLKKLEDAPDCLECTANREILEHAWQVVANEYYDPYGKFSQADWAGVLQKALEGNGGVLFFQCPPAVSTAFWHRCWDQRTQLVARPLNTGQVVQAH